MNWRRGRLLAGIHLAICLPLVVWQEAGYWRQLESSSAHPRVALLDAGLRDDMPAIIEEPVTVNFDCRGLWYHIPLQMRIIRLFELPAAALSGWQEPCPVPWTVSGYFDLDAGRHTRSKEFVSATALFFLIVVQWLVVGSAPLIRPRTWYLESGACITVCLVFCSVVAVVAALLEKVHFFWVEGVMLAPGLLALLAMALGLLAWLWYFGLLLWIPVHKAWLTTLGGLRRLNS